VNYFRDNNSKYRIKPPPLPSRENFNDCEWVNRSLGARNGSLDRVRDPRGRGEDGNREELSAPFRGISLIIARRRFTFPEHSCVRRMIDAPSTRFNSRRDIIRREYVSARFLLSVNVFVSLVVPR